MTVLTPDIATEYYEMLDGLLVAMYQKNPPGRMIRDQWTYKLSSLPDFSGWRNAVDQDEIEVKEENLIDIPNDKVGLLRSNAKLCFPSDNSIIRVDKH